MNVFEAWYVDRLRLRPPADEALFAKWTAGLPLRPEDMPFTSGPHCVRPMRAALALTKAKRVLEVGFNLGHSAAIWLGLGVKRVVSIEVARRPEIAAAAVVLAENYGERFRLVVGDSKSAAIEEKDFDLMFIDGAHDEASVSADITLGRRLGGEWFLFDDFNPHWGPGVAPAIAASGLVPVALLGNMLLATEANEWIS